MPNYNHAGYLPGALQAILGQSYRPAEIIVLDDCSTDQSVDIVEGFARKDPLVRLVRNERNMGVNYSVSRLVEMASGDYVCSTAADDRLLPGFLEKSMRLLARHPRAGLCSTMSKVVDAATERETNVMPLENVSAREGYVSPEEALSWFRRRESWIMGNTCVYRRAALVEAGGFIPELHAFADGFIQMVLALKHGACFIPEPLAVWRVSPSGYATESVTNLDVSLEMWSNAARLMRTTYGDLFPRDYADAWEKRHLYHARLSALNKLQKQQLAVVEGFTPGRGFVDRVFKAGTKGIIRAQLLALTGCLLLRFGRGIWPVLSQGVKVALQRFRLKRKAPGSPSGTGEMELDRLG